LLKLEALISDFFIAGEETTATVVFWIDWATEGLVIRGFLVDAVLPPRVYLLGLDKDFESGWGVVLVSKFV
jgi:hypothetical protein